MLPNIVHSQTHKLCLHSYRYIYIHSHTHTQEGKEGGKERGGGRERDLSSSISAACRYFGWPIKELGRKLTFSSPEATALFSSSTRGNTTHLCWNVGWLGPMKVLLRGFHCWKFTGVTPLSCPEETIPYQSSWSSGSSHPFCDISWALDEEVPFGDEPYTVSVHFGKAQLVSWVLGSAPPECTASTLHWAFSPAPWLSLVVSWFCLLFQVSFLF